ncbi:MAG: hypothetical protein KF802_02835 [Bdellovibrionaceae bacterium]|nr:hypothetical protein [Pseudobdellovibrionaceae bacterium]
MNKKPNYHYRPLRPLKFYEDFLKIDTKQFAGKSGVFGIGLENITLMQKVVVQHIKDTLPEWESYSPELLRVIELNFRTALLVEAWGKTKHTVVLTFINDTIGSFSTKAVIKEPNIFDLEFLREMAILQHEAWPKLAS